MYLHEQTEKYVANDNTDELVTSENDEARYDCGHCQINPGTENDSRAHGETSHRNKCQGRDCRNKNTRPQESHRKEKETSISKDVDKEWLDEIMRKYENIQENDN